MTPLSRQLPAGRADCLSLLFCDKLDLFDLPALCEVYALGLCRPPRFLPPWISGPRDLLVLTTFSVFASRVGRAPIVEVVQRLLESAPACEYPWRAKAERAYSGPL